MASNDRVRLTYQQLVKLSEKYEQSEDYGTKSRSKTVQNKSQEQRAHHSETNLGKAERQKRNKRPDRAIYQPRHIKSDEVEENEHSVERNDTQSAEPAEETDSKSKRKQKRPDIQIYKPKSRQKPGEPLSPPDEVSKDLESLNMGESNEVSVQSEKPPRKTKNETKSKSENKPNNGDKRQNRKNWKESSRNPSIQSDPPENQGTNIHDVSHESLEWDYTESLEFTNSKYPAQDDGVISQSESAQSQENDRHTDFYKEGGHFGRNKLGDQDEEGNQQAHRKQKQNAKGGSQGRNYDSRYEKEKSQHQPKKGDRSMKKYSEEDAIQDNYQLKEISCDHRERTLSFGEESYDETGSVNENRKRGKGKRYSRNRRKEESKEEEKYTTREPDEDERKDSGRKIHLKVTFAQDERQVKVVSDRETSSEEKEMNIPERESGSSRIGKAQRPEKTGTHVGGLIRLPSNPTQQEHVETNTHNHPPHHGHPPHKVHGNAHPHQHPHQQQPYSQYRHHPQNQGRGMRGGPMRGRGGAHRTLYDPNNPSKPLSISNPRMQFVDEQQFSPDAYMSYSDYYHDYAQGNGQYQNMGMQGFAGSPGSIPGGGDQPGYLFNYPVQYGESVGCQDDTYAKDPYYHSDFEPEANGSRAKSGNATEAKTILKEVCALDSQLNNLISRRIHGDEGLQKIMELRREVQTRYMEVVLLDTDLANKHNVEQQLWKSTYYQVFEVLRKHIAADGREGDNPAKNCLAELVEEGVSFYEDLLHKLQMTYKFQLEEFLDCNQLPAENISRSVKLALLSAQRSMICLGDIARYKEQVNQTTNYGKARSWYMKAQQIAPKNGRPYNQLAILALYTRRKLDAVYYYMRSLAASNPFLTARESLMSLFDEARKKLEMTEQKRLQERVKLRKRQRRRSSQGHRLEIWISHDGTSSEDQIDDDDDDLSKLSAVELNKRFILSFLNVQGKLFTKIGMEAFPEVSSNMLYEFQALLQHSPSPVGNIRLLQLMAINMFIIENTTPKESEMEENCRSLLQEQSVQLGLDMFGLIVNRCVNLFRDHLDSNDVQIMNEDLHQLFPSVKVWSDWMACHFHLWNPPPLPRDPELGPNINVWQEVADLCNILKEVDISYVKLYKDKKENCGPVILGEDVMMAGFVPLLSFPKNAMYVHNTVDKEMARDCLRVEKLKFFGDYLCGMEPPVLEYNVETHLYQSNIEEIQDELQSTDTEEHSHHEGDDVIIESEEEEDMNSNNDEEHIYKLKAKRQELQKQVEEQERQQQNIQAVLNDNSDRPIELEIRPTFLIPDTNCFIESLEEMQMLIAARRYTVVVPLVVINELDGLAKGQREGQYESLAHAQMVLGQAKESIQYLEERFEKRTSHLKALTSKGSVMDTIAYRSEEASDDGNNDDMILSCCLHYCNDKARDFMPRDKHTPIRLQREVVLLTDDRNLRVKAHMRNVPVKDLPSFLHWAKVG